MMVVKMVPLLAVQSAEQMVDLMEKLVHLKVVMMVVP